MEFRILGPLEVVDEEQRRVRLPGPKTRALLAELLINANQVVSVDRLVEAVWGEDAPETAAKTLQTYVLQLRKAVEPGRAPGTTGEVLLTRDSGYLLAVHPEQVDALRFERLVEEGRDALSGVRARASRGGARRGAGLVARSGTGRRGGRVVRPARGGPPRGAAPGRPGGPHRGRPGRRAAGAGGRAGAARGPPPPA